MQTTLPAKMTVTGVVATEPRVMTTSAGLKIVSFRLASPNDRHDTNWFTVNVFGELADHVAASLKKGERVIAAGSFQLRSWESEDKYGVTAEIAADTLGHDLNFGTSQFTRTLPHSPIVGPEAPLAPHANTQQESAPEIM